ncbi:MAG: sigma-70 family RNA polymerase sigma factor [Sphingobacteriaceae bacterium]|nr:sigma-70 family RNA polymerase sigma factor [Cytophagaceae bacterium]
MFLQRLRRSTQPPDEAALLRQYRQTGELSVLGTLYEPYLDLVFAVCYQHLRDEDEAKDAVMQVFEKLMLELRRHEVTNFRSWLHSVARNECLMRLRQRRTTGGRVDVFSENGVELAALAHPSDEDSGPLDIHLDRLGPCLDVLTKEQKTSVTLFFYEEKSYREISDLTGYGLNDVKSYLQNGKRNLKKCLERGERIEERG